MNRRVTSGSLAAGLRNIITLNRLRVFAEFARRFRDLVTFPPGEVETSPTSNTCATPSK
jgi:hypothetical protein